MIKLRFVEGGAWDSKIIRYDSRCRWSHVEVLSEDGSLTFGAQLQGGVRWRSVKDACYNRALNYQVIELLATPAQHKAFWDFLLAQNTKPYDWRAIASFGLGERDWRENDSWFCSELQTRALECASLIHLPEDIPVSRITPRDLWVLIAGLTAQ